MVTSGFYGYQWFFLWLPEAVYGHQIPVVFMVIMVTSGFLWLPEAVMVNRDCRLPENHVVHVFTIIVLCYVTLCYVIVVHVLVNTCLCVYKYPSLLYIFSE